MDKPYRSAQTIIKWTMGLLICMIGFDLIFIAVDVTAMALYPDFYNIYSTAPLSAGEQALAYASMIFGGLMVLFFIPTIVMFCVWIFRASKNARALGAQNMKHAAGIAAGGFFIPFANLVLPYLAAREIERASDPHSGPTDWHYASNSGRVGVWWSFWIISNISSQVSMEMTSSTNPEVLRASSVPAMLGSMASIAAAILAIRMMKHIHRLQETKIQLQPDAVQRTCLYCGYDIRGTPGLSCPECGASIPGRHEYDMQLEAPEPESQSTSW